MTLFKIRHLPTGLYYMPAKGFSWERTNLSPNGKVYHKKPALKHIGHGYHRVVEGRSEFFKYVESEWKVVEAKVGEFK